MAQTALADAEYVAKSLSRAASGREVGEYVQPAPAYAVPVGPGQAAVLYMGMSFTGRVGWFLRRAADFRAFLSLLSPLDALRTFISGIRGPSEDSETSAIIGA